MKIQASLVLLIIGFCLDVFAAPADAFAVLAKNREAMFAYGMGVVARDPMALLVIAASRGETDETLQALSARVDELSKPDRKADIKLVKGEVLFGGKPSGLRVVSYAPNVTFSYRGSNWTYASSKPMDVNFNSLFAFLHGRSSAALRTLLPEAQAADVLESLTPATDWYSLALTSAAVGGAVGGVAAGPVGAVVGAVGGGIVGYAGNAVGVAGKKERQVCAFVNTKEGQTAMANFKDVSVKCEAAATPANTKGEKDFSIVFSGGSGAAAQTGFTFPFNKYSCCDVQALNQYPPMHLGKLSMAERDQIKAALGGCDGSSQSLPDVQKQVRSALGRLFAMSNFCGYNTIMKPKPIVK